MKLSLKTLTALALGALGLAASAMAAEPTPVSRLHTWTEPGGHESRRERLHGLQRIRQRRVAQGEPDTGGSVVLGLLHDPRRDQPRQPAQGSREGRSGQELSRGFRRAQGRRFLGQLHGRGRDRSGGVETDRAGAGAHRQDRERRGPSGARSRGCKPRRQRRVPLHGRAGPPQVDRGDRLCGPGRPRAAGPRLLPEDRRRVQGGSARSTSPTCRRCSRSWARIREGRGRRQDGDGPRDQAGRGVDDARRAPRPRRDVQPQDARRAGQAHAPLLLDRLLQGRGPRADRGQRRAAQVLRGLRQGAARRRRSRSGRPTSGGT